MTNKVETADQARAIVLEAVRVIGAESVLDLVTDWNNTTDNQISDKGNVWVSNPQTGHWLNDDHLIEFAESLEA